MATIKIMNNSDINIPKFIYTSLAFKKIRLFLKTKHAEKNEFMFLGKVSKDKNDYILEDVYIVPQEKCNGAWCETDDERFPEWLNTINIEDRKKLRLHGHSHVNMTTSPSSVDNDQIKELSKNVKDFYIQLIVNHQNINTVNIYDKKTNLIFEKVDEFIKIGDILIPIINGKAKIAHSNLNLNVKQNYSVSEDMEIILNKNVLFNIPFGKLFVFDDNIYLDNESNIIITNEKIEIKETEKIMEENIKQKIFAPGNYYYYDDYFIEDTIKKGKKRGLK